MREERTTLGAIRWDAWWGHCDDPHSVEWNVEHTLSPAKYHFRVPFFGKITPTGDVRFPAYTQETFDAEARLAIDAGIDYFAYCWYSGPMALARKCHEKSALREKIKLCALFDGNGLCRDYAREEMAELIGQPFYMRVLDRPLICYFCTNKNYDKIGEDIAFYRELCAKKGLKAPYSVVMGGWPEPTKAIGGDALCRYSIGASGGISFQKLTDTCEEVWTHHQHLGLDNVLPLTAGWHPLPRAERPVFWMNVAEDSFAQYASAEEIGAHIRRGIDYLSCPENAPETPANTMILYAWNEHDEGGWICPTLAVDENGNQRFDENGAVLIDRSRLDAVKEALKNR